MNNRAAKCRPRVDKTFEWSNLLTWNIVYRAVITRRIQWQNAFHRITSRSTRFAVFKWVAAYNAQLFSAYFTKYILLRLIKSMTSGCRKTNSSPIQLKSSCSWGCRRLGNIKRELFKLHHQCIISLAKLTCTSERVKKQIPCLVLERYTVALYTS